MQVPNTFYIVLPIVATICLAVLVGLPLLADSYEAKRQSRRPPSGPAVEAGHLAQVGREGPADTEDHSSISSA